MIGGTIKPIAPQDIERTSFSMIESEFAEQTGINPESIEKKAFSIIRRVIHATGDFSFAQSLVFHEHAITEALVAIRQGRSIAIDVTMGAAGINRRLLSSFGGAVRCDMSDPEIVGAAQRSGRTRTETALRRVLAEHPGIAVVGNAPTALLATIEMIAEGASRPAVVIGVPVGFVNAAESKALLMTQDYPFIANHGRKGGSAVAVAIVNALLHLAVEKEEQ